MTRNVKWKLSATVSLGPCCQHLSKYLLSPSQHPWPFAHDDDSLTQSRAVKPKALAPSLPRKENPHHRFYQQQRQRQQLHKQQLRHQRLQSYPEQSRILIPTYEAAQHQAYKPASPSESGSEVLLGIHKALRGCVAHQRFFEESSNLEKKYLKMAELSGQCDVCYTQGESCTCKAWLGNTNLFREDLEVPYLNSFPELYAPAPMPFLDNFGMEYTDEPSKIVAKASADIPVQPYVPARLLSHLSNMVTAPQHVDNEFCSSRLLRPNTFPQMNESGSRTKRTNPKRSSTEESKFPCRHGCEESFTSARNRRRHGKSSCPNQLIRTSISCPIAPCTRKFSRSDARTKHVKEQHKVCYPCFIDPTIFNSEFETIDELNQHKYTQHKQIRRNNSS